MKAKAIFLRITLMSLGLFLVTCKNEDPQPEPVITAQPAITSFSPLSGSANAQVTIIGKNFKEGVSLNTIKFNGIAAVVQSASTTQLVTTVPEGATSGKITVTVVGVTVSSESDFTVSDPSQPQPLIASFTPASGYKDTQVTITGSNFKADLVSNIVKFNGITAVVKSASTTQLITTVPTGAVSGKITVTIGGATGISPTDFIVLIPETITSFTPTSGPSGTIVTITGTNFSTNISDNIVLFNGKEATIISATATTLVVTVPVGATTGRISVTINNTDAISSTDFTVN